MSIAFHLKQICIPSLISPMAVKFLLNIQALKLLLNNPICTMQAAAIHKTDRVRHSVTWVFLFQKNDCSCTTFSFD